MLNYQGVYHFWKVYCIDNCAATMMFEPPSPKTKLPMSILCLFASRAALEIVQKQLQNSSHETSTPWM